jgi:hypothetical protein
MHERIPPLNLLDLELFPDEANPRVSLLIFPREIRKPASKCGASSACDEQD